MKPALATLLGLLWTCQALAQLPAPHGSAPPTFVSAGSTAGQAHPAVARIVAPGNGSISYGSGTLVYAQGQVGVVVTNWHVINEATGPISVHFPDGFYSPGSVRKVDHDWDLALIVIQRPNVEPVALATQPPQPGDVLTIAGYGSGNYRAASGRCTQYVAPGTTFPYEMLEVSVAARQGDSGGPIFNSRGELAGVLFGEGNGRTSGSYCGRVRWFLASVVPTDNPDAQVLASAPRAPVPSRPFGQSDAAGTQSVASPRFAQANSTWLAKKPGSTTTAAPTVPTATLPVATTAVATAPAGPVAQTLGWEDIAGQTLGEQIKTVLAFFGALAIVLHTLRWLSSERTAA